MKIELVRCAHCKQHKGRDQFNAKSKNSTGGSGLQPYCRQCDAEAHREYRRRKRQEAYRSDLNREARSLAELQPKST